MCMKGIKYETGVKRNLNRTEERHSNLEFRVKKKLVQSDPIQNESLAQLLLSFKTMVLDLKQIMEKFKSIFNDEEVSEYLLGGQAIKQQLL